MIINLKGYVQFMADGVGRHRSKCMSLVIPERHGSQCFGMLPKKYANKIKTPRGSSWEIFDATVTIKIKEREK